VPKVIIYITPLGRRADYYDGRQYDFDAIFSSFRSGIQKIIPDTPLVRVTDIPDPDAKGPADPIDFIKTADVVVCDLTTANPNCLYELGLAHAFNKPTIAIAARTAPPIPFDIANLNLIIYDPDNISVEIIDLLASRISQAIQNPEKFLRDQATAARDRKVFISYSRKDKEYLERLLVHLKPLERAGLIDAWVDTRLKAGDRWKKEIELALQRASVAIILVSADFLASDFVVENELPPILAKAELEGTLVLPLIVKPCRFGRDQQLSRFQSHNPPEVPLSSLDDSQREAVFDALAQRLEEWVPLNR
jgi:TIR domain